MVLNNYGEIVKEEWFLSGAIRDEVILDTFMVMPNHIHGIIFIQNSLNPDVGASGARPK